ncbi:SRPBCC domain-containing protein [Flavivirga algicola]|uniref:Activator of HSP90 ATPase n=1 Tax=Flavivirga algicola TaxID=2729136 RepID=A0ABX1S3N2_9FLAO|nr:SRPBCC domain-containing protein [Flavivirga algicola]NMH89364.1 activator of HSP90 ATPase [Flavivirga algicola]
MYSITKSITIDTTKEKLWKALVTPEIIEQYLMGAQVSSDWKVGSKIEYRGEFNGIPFCDEGTIDLLDIEKEYKYSYWSANHGTIKSKENFVSISYKIENKKTHVNLVVNQTNYKSKKIADGMNQIWDFILDNLKKVLETKNE